MKIFAFVKKVFFIGLEILADCTNASSPLNVKQDHKLLMLMEMNMCFFHLVLKQVNVVVAVIILTIHIEKFVLLIL